MDELPRTPVELVAIDAARNIRRRWRIAADRDLFGQVMIETDWGRIGGRGRTLTRSFGAETDALRYVNVLLARRSTAVRRIGVDYRPEATSRRTPDRPTHLPHIGASFSNNLGSML